MRRPLIITTDELQQISDDWVAELERLENRGADRSGGKADEIGAEGGERRRKRFLVGEVKLAEDETGRGAIKEKVVPLRSGVGWATSALWQRNCYAQLGKLRD